MEEIKAKPLDWLLPTSNLTAVIFVASQHPIKQNGNGPFSKGDSRVFSKAVDDTGGLMWFFRSREGEIGPYDTEEAAEQGLLSHIENNKKAQLHKDPTTNTEVTTMASLNSLKHDSSATYQNRSRVFAQADGETGQSMWFFHSREGAMGPYESEESARLGLLLKIESYRQANLRAN